MLNTKNTNQIHVGIRCLVSAVVFILMGCQVCNAAAPKPVIVSSLKELKSAVSKAGPGTTILIKPGIYNGGFYISKTAGTQEQPIIIKGEDSKLPPVFKGKREGLKISSAAYLQIGNIVFSGFGNNGINIDDGGKTDTPSHHIYLHNIRIENTGGKSNQDALKMSGVDHFFIRDLEISGWGGSGIDMVGCHFGILQDVFFEGLPGFRTKNGLQIKGGSHDILVQNCMFMNCGERSTNIGGSTGLQYFRPQMVDFEAKRIVLAGNVFIGGEAQAAFVTAMDVYVHHNIFYLPGKYVWRLLREAKEPRFISTQQVFFEDNLVVTDKRVNKHLNIGPNTKPDTLSFHHNAWYQFEAEVKPDLPTIETKGIYGVYPELLEFGTRNMKLDSRIEAFNNIGPDFYTPAMLDNKFSDIPVPQIKYIKPVEKKNASVTRITLIGGFIAIAALTLIIRCLRK